VDDRRGVSLIVLASVGVAVVALATGLFMPATTESLVGTIVAAVALGLASGLFYGGVSGYFNRPNVNRTTSIFALNVAPEVLAVIVLWAVFSSEDLSLRILALAGVFGAGIGNAAALLAWGAIRQRRVA
jgi:ABC-type dipeptide/oligopeptide/nickel transport system permease subunit